RDVLGREVERVALNVIERGKPDESELVARIVHDDPEKRMPPQATGKTLTASQIDILKKWIEQGATWQQHWSLIAPARAPLPTVQDEKWIINPIDRFILHELEKNN